MKKETTKLTKRERLEAKFNQAMEEASNVFGVDPAYFGKEGDEEVDRQLKKLGTSLEELRKEFGKKYFVTKGLIGYMVIYEDFEPRNNVGNYYVTVSEEFDTEDEAEQFANELNQIHSAADLKSYYERINDTESFLERAEAGNKNVLDFAGQFVYYFGTNAKTKFIERCRELNIEFFNEIVKLLDIENQKEEYVF